MFDLTNVGYVERIVVGSKDPENLTSETVIQAAVDLLNRCLTEEPKGKIIGVEKTFSLLNIGEHQVVLQCMIYHVGFKRRPYWLAEARQGAPAEPARTSEVLPPDRQMTAPGPASDAGRTARPRRGSS